MSVDLHSNAAWEASTLCTLYKQLVVGAKPLPQAINLAGQTAVITGANGGLGFEAGRQLLQLGLSKLVLAVRSESRGATAANELRQEFPHSTIVVFIVDLADYRSIIEFRDSCKKLERIDYLILNAGLMANSHRLVDKTGHEEVFQINYLSTVLMVLVLLPVLISKGQHINSTKAPVLSIVGSDTMYLSTFKPTGSIISTMDDPSLGAGLSHYADTKLLLMMFMSRLATRVKPEDVIINVCNPGFTSGTGLGHNQEQGWLAKTAVTLMSKGMARSLQAGASIYIYALLAAGIESHGSFVSDWDIKPYAPIMYTSKGEEISDALWEETMQEHSFAKELSIESLFS